MQNKTGDNMNRPRTILKLTAALAIAAAFPAQADINIGAVLPLTGATSALGIPSNNGFKLWPAEIAGEKVNVTILDDATDPTTATRNARRLVTEEKVDMLVGSVATPSALAIVDLALETRTPQLALSPVPVPAGRDTWTFRLAHSSTVMANAALAHMAKQGIKTLGFLGYTDAYGETWLKDMQELADAYGIKLVATERFQRTDTSVTGQTLKLLAAKPDAILVVASGSGAAMPHRALVERGYKGKIYQTHAAASRDLIRVGGKAVEGAYAPVRPGRHCRATASQPPIQGCSQRLRAELRANIRRRHPQPVQRPRLRHPVAAATSRARSLETGRARHTGLPCGAARRAGKPARHSRFPGSDRLHRQRPLGLHPESPVVMKIVDGDWVLETD